MIHQFSLFKLFSIFFFQDIIGKTDVEIFTGSGVKENQDFKREVLEKGLPAKREITFETELFGSKTFLIYVEPVFSKAGETIGINYMGMDVTDQVNVNCYSLQNFWTRIHILFCLYFVLEGVLTSYFLNFWF